MNSREVTVRVQCDLPNDIAVDEFREYVLASVNGEGSPLLDESIIESITVKRIYQRK